MQRIQIPDIAHPRALLLIMRKALHDAGWREGFSTESDKTNAEDMGYKVPVVCDSEQRQIRIGEYIGISGEQFAGFVWYLARGGKEGWIDNDFPDFTFEALSALKSPQNNAFCSSFDYVAYEESREIENVKVCQDTRVQCSALSREERAKLLEEALVIICTGEKKPHIIDLHHDPNWGFMK